VYEVENIQRIFHYDSTMKSQQSWIVPTITELSHGWL